MEQHKVCRQFSQRWVAHAAAVVLPAVVDAVVVPLLPAVDDAVVVPVTGSPFRAGGTAKATAPDRLLRMV